MTRREVIKAVTKRLEPVYDSREAENIALRVVSELCGVTISELRINPATECHLENLDQIVEELAAARPVQYVLGHSEFYGRDFTVREGVLIPRPETEELVQWIIREEGAAHSILDVGTGSGCIAATLAAELPQTEVAAVDISPEALDIAAENCRRLGVEVELKMADALEGLEGAFEQKFDILVSNPPYIPESERGAMHRNVVEHEPGKALFVPDSDPLLFYRAIARAGQNLLDEGGRLYFEIHHAMAEQMEGMLAAEGYRDIRIRRDMAEKPRMVCCRKR